MSVLIAISFVVLFSFLCDVIGYKCHIYSISPAKEKDEKILDDDSAKRYSDIGR